MTRGRCRVLATWPVLQFVAMGDILATTLKGP